MKNNNLFWSLSLIVISLCSLIWVGSSMIGIELPDILIRVLGILDLICVAILVYTSVKKKKK